MKRTWLMMILLSFGACVNHDLESIEKTVDSNGFWIPGIVAQKGDAVASILLANPLPSTSYVGAPPSDPDYFKIWISDDGENFSVFKKVNVKTTVVDVTDLTNGESYYFFVSAHKGDATLETRRVMTIPSTQAKMERYLPNLNFQMETLLVSFDQKFISYFANSRLYYQTAPTGLSSLLASNAYGGKWSTLANKLVYIETKTLGFATYPFELKLFNAESQTTTALFEIDFNNYYVANPSFTPDGSKVSFLSSEGNKQKYTYDLWTVVPSTGEKTRLSNFEEIGFTTDSWYNWNASGTIVYLEGRFDLEKPNVIYQFETATKKLTPVIASEWNEKSPTLSPDQTKLIFTSNRTGKDELWLFDLQNKTYQQITGESAYHFDSRYTQPTWLGNTQLLITIYKNEQWIPVTITIDQ